MLGNLFKKEFTNDTFYLELLRDEYHEKWLNEALLSDTVDINYKDEENNTFLMLCIKESKTLSAKWLLDHDIELNTKNNDNKTALFIAIEKNNKEIVENIISHDSVNLEQKDSDGRTILQNVVVSGYNTMAKILIKNGANLNNIDNKNRNIIYDALSYGDKVFIQYLLNQKKLDLNYIDENGNSIMHHSQVIQDNEIAILLLNAGADPTLQNKQGESYLYNTALKGKDSEKVIDIALENGADVNSPTANGNTILMDLITLSSTMNVDETEKRESLLRISRKMLKHGGDVNAIEKNSESGLFNAVRLCDYELVEFLLLGGIDPNIINDNGITVLNLIIYEGVKELKIIQLLIQYGANPNIRDNDGRTIYEHLTMIILHNYGSKIILDKTITNKINTHGQYILIVKEFLDNKSDIDNLNYSDSTGDPLFFKPLLYDQFTLFKLYIKHGVNIHLINKANHNIFFEYVLKIFTDNKVDSITCEKFQNNISYLLSKKVQRNYQDKLGWTVLHKIMATECNEILYDILTKIVIFDFTLVDFQGRTIAHNAVWSNQINIVKKIYLSAPSSINISDNYGILPITYAALLGNQELVLLFLELGSNISGSKGITKAAIKKFSPMLKNLSKIKMGIEDISLIKKIDILLEQIIRDFKLI